MLPARNMRDIGVGAFPAGTGAGATVELCYCLAAGIAAQLESVVSRDPPIKNHPIHYGWVGTISEICAIKGLFAVKHAVLSADKSF